MITLTSPASINSVLGGNVPVSYNKLIINNINLDTVTRVIRGNLVLTSTGNPDMQPITGSLSIVYPNFVEVSVQQLDFYRRIVLSPGQQNAVVNLVGDFQNSLEAGLISLGLISGTQSAGT